MQNNEQKFTMPLLSSEDIEVKVKQVTKSGALGLLYKTARTDRKYLNQVFGPLNWTSDYKVIKDNLYCGIGCRLDPSQEFVWKWDCGIESRSDDEGNEKKGEASDAFKRAGYAWNIGEELYTAPVIWLEVQTKPAGNGSSKYVLEDPRASYIVTKIEYNEQTRVITDLEISNEKTGVVVYEYHLDETGAIAKKMVETTATRKKIPSRKEQQTTVNQLEGKPSGDSTVTAESQPELELTDQTKTLVELVNGIGQKLKAMKAATKTLDQYNAIVLKVTGSNTFRCNTATEEQYGTVEAIYNELEALGY